MAAFELNRFLETFLDYLWEGRPASGQQAACL